MKNYNFYYNNCPITRAQFEAVVPKDWEENCDEFGEYSYGYYRAITRGE
jgi:hypothetical protein